MSKHQQFKNRGTSSKKVQRKVRADARAAEFDKLSIAEQNSLKAFNKRAYDSSKQS